MSTGSIHIIYKKNREDFIREFNDYLDKGGEYRFRLKATNGQIIAVSEGYTAKPGCLNGIESVRKNAADADIKVKE